MKIKDVRAKKCCKKTGLWIPVFLFFLLLACPAALAATAEPPTASPARNEPLPELFQEGVYQNGVYSGGLFDRAPLLQVAYCAETRGEYLPCGT